MINDCKKLSNSKIIFNLQLLGHVMSMPCYCSLKENCEKIFM